MDRLVKIIVETPNVATEIKENNKSKILVLIPVDSVSYVKRTKIVIKDNTAIIFVKLTTFSLFKGKSYLKIPSKGIDKILIKRWN